MIVNKAGKTIRYKCTLIYPSAQGVFVFSAEDQGKDVAFVNLNGEPVAIVIDPGFTLE